MGWTICIGIVLVLGAIGLYLVRRFVTPDPAREIMSDRAEFFENQSEEG